MKKMILLIITFLFSFSLASARDFEFRAYYPKTGKTIQCVRIYFGSKGNTCYSLVNGKVKSQGVGIIQQFTGLYDSNRVKIYEGDRVQTPNGADGIITWLDTLSYVGWYIVGDNGILYTFSNLSTQPESTWSMVIK